MTNSVNIIASDPEQSRLLQLVLSELGSVKAMLRETQTELKRIQRENEPAKTVGAGECAKLCGVSYNYFINFVRYERGFPKPIKGTEGKNKRPKWYRQDIIDYREANSGLQNE